MITVLVDLAGSSGGVVMSCGWIISSSTLGRDKVFFTSAKCPAYVWFPPILVSGYQGAFFSGWGIKWLKCGFDHLHPFSAEVNKLVQVDPSIRVFSIHSFNYPQFTMA